MSVSLLLVVVSGPVIGAVADSRAWKKELLVWFWGLCVALTVGLAFVPSGEGGVWAVALAMALYIPANIAFNLGENMLAAFLPELAGRGTIGRVSAIGWTMGYVGALALLVLTLVLMLAFDLRDESQWRPLFVFAGLWFGVMALPTVLLLKEEARPRALPGARTLVGAGVKRVVDSVTHASAFRDLSVFLVAFFVYAFGVQAVIFFSGIIARDDFGFGTTKLVLFIAVTAIAAGVGAVAVGMVQDRLGHKNTVAVVLGLWVLNGLGLAGLAWGLDLGMIDRGPAEGVLWVLGNGIGLALGAVGSASRACVGYFTPRHRTAEFFGLWGLAYKSAGVFGAAGFGAVREAFGGVASLLSLAAVFAVGGAVLSFVDEARGGACATRAEEESLGGGA